MRDSRCLVKQCYYMFGEYFSSIHLDTHDLYSRLGPSNSKQNGYNSINVNDLGSKKRPLGLRLALVTILNGKMGAFLCLMGLMCSSFVSISSGTHRRAPFDPLGRSEIPMVALGNGLASRSLVSYNLLENVGKQIDKHCFALCKAYMGTFNQTLCIGHQHELDLFQHGAPPQQKPWTGQSVSQTLILGLNGYTQPPGLCKGDKVVAMPCDIW